MQVQTQKSYDRKFTEASARHIEQNIAELKKLNTKWLGASKAEKKRLQPRINEVRGEMSFIGGLSEPK